MFRISTTRVAMRLVMALLAFGAAAVAVRATPVDAAEAARRHLRLLRAEPAADTVLATTPKSVRLWFSERPEIGVTTMRLTGPSGAVALGAITQAAAPESPIVASIEGTMAPGAYTVAWRTMASDGHVLSGTVKFRLAPH